MSCGNAGRDARHVTPAFAWLAWRHRNNAKGNAAMNALAAPKSPQQNRLEGFALTALFLGFPTYAGAALALKLTGAHEIVGERWGAAIFVALAAMFHGLFTPWLGSKFPRFANGYAPCFFDETLSFAEKIA